MRPLIAAMYIFVLVLVCLTPAIAQPSTHPNNPVLYIPPPKDTSFGRNIFFLQCEEKAPVITLGCAKGRCIAFKDEHWIDSSDEIKCPLLSTLIPDYRKEDQNISINAGSLYYSGIPGRDIGNFNIGKFYTTSLIYRMDKKSVIFYIEHINPAGDAPLANNNSDCESQDSQCSVRISPKVDLLKPFSLIHYSSNAAYLETQNPDHSIIVLDLNKMKDLRKNFCSDYAVIIPSEKSLLPSDVLKIVLSCR